MTADEIIEAGHDRRLGRQRTTYTGYCGGCYRRLTDAPAYLYFAGPRVVCQDCAASLERRRTVDAERRTA